jgi:hypothetical protein
MIAQNTCWLCVVSRSTFVVTVDLYRLQPGSTRYAAWRGRLGSPIVHPQRRRRAQLPPGVGLFYLPDYRIGRCTRRLR